MTRIFALFVLVWVVFTANPAMAQTPESGEQVYVVQSGDSLYGIVKMQFPDHRGSWLEVAERLVELNPDAFPRGLDTPLRPGTQLLLFENPTEPSTQSNNTVTSTDPAVTKETAPPSDFVATDGAVNTARDASQGSSAVAGVNSVANRPPQIGTVALAGGRVIAINLEERRRILTDGAGLFAGDTVRTDGSASVKVHMIDDAIYLLRRNSSLAFETYSYTAANRKGTSVITLISGGFRATGGYLAKYNGGNVAYNTPVATIGVRGTDFGLRLCSNNTCRSTNGDRSFADGLYTGVLDGSLVVTNNSGELLTGKGEFYRVKNPADEPVPAPEAALLIFTPEELAALDIGADAAEPLSFWAWLVNFLFGD
ncbi:MAG: hypothetical protein HKN70_12150 [Gammaproteobacteria bacterium]|nr:hypothetical protein [Gammaproteobacteria bacterium]